MKIFKLLKEFSAERNLGSHSRPYFNHSVEFKQVFTVEDRIKMLENIGLNVFFFPSQMISGCDLLSDSGVTTMTNEQWAALHLGDEAYGSNKGYFLLMEQIKDIFGKEFFNHPTSKNPNAFIFHQGRACEDALFTFLGKLGHELIIPSNGHFDTTQANIEANNISALNIFSSELINENSKYHFKGNMDVEKYKYILKKSSDKIPLTYLTITNNTGGGQPVSMKNIKEISELSHSCNIPLFFDACRFAENAWFIKSFEKEYRNKTIKDIVKEMFLYADGFTISFKKDGLANIGGGLFIKNNGLFMKKYPSISNALINYQILKEGHPTYGGLSGRDIMSISVGLKTVIKEEYLTHRINQVNDFGSMYKDGIPILTPIGGHAIYLDVNKFFSDTKMKPEYFGGISLTAILLAIFGHRACELGYFAFGHYDKKRKKEIFPEMNYVRFAVPRLRYEKQDLDSVADAIKILYEHRHKLPPVKVTYGRDLPLRHFKARFEFQNF
ncbi:MAG: tryptophanase [Bacteroidota bacterium]